MKQVADCIVQVTIHYFKKGDKVFMKHLEDLCSLGGTTWEDASEEIPEAERGPKENMVGQIISMDEYTDTVFTQDWIGFEFFTMGEGTEGWTCGVDYYVENCGTEETFEPFREDLLKLAPPLHPKKKSVRFLTAFSYWSCRGYDDEYEDGIELIGRLDLSNVNILTQEWIDAGKNPKSPVKISLKGN